MFNAIVWFLKCNLPEKGECLKNREKALNSHRPPVPTPGPPACCPLAFSRKCFVDPTPPRSCLCLPTPPRSRALWAGFFHQDIKIKRCPIKTQPGAQNARLLIADPVRSQSRDLALKDTSSQTHRHTFLPHLPPLYYFVLLRLACVFSLKHGNPSFRFFAFFLRFNMFEFSMNPFAFCFMLLIIVLLRLL